MTVLEEAEAPAPPVSPQRQPAQIPEALLFAAAASMAAAIVLFIQLRLPSRLNVQTDVVGYPTYGNFNVSRYYHLYYLILLVFPAATFVLFSGLSVAARRSGRLRARPTVAESTGGEWMEEAPAADGRHDLVQAGRSLFVGGVTGLEAGIVAGWIAWRLAALVMMGAVLYLALLRLAARLSQWGVLKGMPLRERRASLNATLASAVILGMAAVSDSTRALVGRSGSVAYPWLPTWLPLVTALVIGALVVSALRCQKSLEHVRTIERQVVLLVVAPVCLFLLIALLLGPLGGMDVFHEGEWLVGADLLRRGQFPWRDFAVIHGALLDVLIPSVGMRLLENSRWGVTSGFTLVIGPIYWIFHYYLAVMIFRRNWLGVVGSFLLIVVVVDAGFFSHLRFMLWPLILLTLVGVLRHAQPWRCMVLVVLVAAQVTLTPEALFAGVASGATVVLFELVESRRGASRGIGFRRTRFCAGAAVVSAAAWFGFLSANGAADDYIDQLLAFSRDHRLVGGLPLTFSGTYFPVAAVAPGIAVLITIWYLGAKLRRGCELSVEDWLLVTVAATVALYYQKFLARSDFSHAAHVFAVAIPMLMILIAKVLSWGDRRLAGWRELAGIRRLTERPATLVAVVALLALAPVALPHRLSTVPRRFTPEVSGQEVFPRLGYAFGRWFDRQMMNDLAAVTRSYLRPGEPVFDFTNQPGLIHYLLGHPPATRYYHVSMAVRRNTQRDLIGELARTRPRLVVFQNDERGFPAPDGAPNIIRHYEVSQYLLDNYQPWVEVHRYILFVPRDVDIADLPSLPPRLRGAATGQQLLFHGYPCDWRYVPNFLTTPDADAGRALSLRIRHVGPKVTRLEIPPGTDLSRFRWIDVQGAGRLRAGSFSLGMTGDLGAVEASVAVAPGGGHHPAGGPHRAILFQSLGDRPSIRVRVGSCPAWHAYATGSLDLTHGPDQRIAAVRILP